MTRALVIYDSQFGSTEKVALMIVALLRDHNIVTFCKCVGEVDVGQIAGVDILAIGGPTHTFGMSKPMAEFMGRLNGMDLRGKKAFAFDTRFDSILSGSAAKRIEADLQRLGAKIIVPRISAFVSMKGELKRDSFNVESARITIAHMVR